MSTGSLKTAMIVCLQYDVTSIIESVRFYAPNILIIFNEVFSDPDRFPIRSQLSSRLDGQLEQYETNMLIMRFTINIHDFNECSENIEKMTEMFTHNLGIKEVLINITSSTPEFASASTVCSTLHPEVTLFSQQHESASISDFIIGESIKSDEPLSPLSDVSAPIEINPYRAVPPDRNLVIGLRCLSECSENGGTPMAKDMIRRFQEQGIWYRKNPSPSDGVFYLRDFVDRWIENGWIVKGRMRNQYTITDKGRDIIDKLYKNDETLLEEFQSLVDIHTQ